MFVLSQPVRTKSAPKPKRQPEVNPPKEQDEPQPVASAPAAPQPSAQIEDPALRAEPVVPAKVEPRVGTASDHPSVSEVRGRQSVAWTLSLFLSV